MTEPTTITPLRAADRCDTSDCIARAVVRVHFGESVIDFCGHHIARLEGRAIAQDPPLTLEEVLGNPTGIQDERERIRTEEDKREGVG